MLKDFIYRTYYLKIQKIDLKNETKYVTIRVTLLECMRKCVKYIDKI